MRRKVIQIAGSTQLVSLPREWAKQHGIKKGEEVEVTEDGDRITIRNAGIPQPLKERLDISAIRPMVHRLIGSYYRAGIDEIEITYDDPDFAKDIHESLGRDTTVGFEILKQSSNSSLIRYVAGTLEELDSFLRRTFLLLLNQAEETTKYLREGRYSLLQSVAALEKNNNKLTSLCRRILNKTPNACTFTTRTAPLYFIIEQLENIADQYKYICLHYAGLSNTVKIHPEVLKTFDKTYTLFRDFYTLFYKFDLLLITNIKKTRDQITKESHKAFRLKLSEQDMWLVHHSMMLNTLVFNMVGPYLVINAGPISSG
jgi:phosphate uptake regulator